MANLFNSVRLKRPGKNRFDLSHDVKLSFDMGELIPIMVQECVPGDKFKLLGDAMIRMAPMIAPVMHRLDVSMHYFFVPNRLLWDEWEEWITGNVNVVPPQVAYRKQDYDACPLIDYIGLPENPSTTTYFNVSALPFAAYQCIYNEYYRDQNLIPEINYKVGSGSALPLLTTARLSDMRRRAWKHDYFTAALPFAQKGNAVDIPLGSIDANFPVNANLAGGGTTTLTGSSGNVTVNKQTVSGIAPDSLYADVNASLTPTTINDLRRAFRLQEWLERNARGGTRYTESILAHFGVRSSDKRMQRPEYICGSKSPIVISEVLNTTGSDEALGLPQGNMSGHGVGVSSGKLGNYFCEEHGFIIGIMSVLPLPAYQQGIPRHYDRLDRFSYYWPEFANIGEQPVKNKEIFAPHTSPDGTFGYVPRYAEYKYNPSRVAGDFKTSLDYWHLGRIFSSQPALNKAFIECNPGKRIFAVEGAQDSLYAHVLNKVTAIRSMPKYGDPML